MPPPVPVPADPAQAVPRAVAAEPPRVLAGVPWEELASLVRECRRCGLCEGRTKTVFGEGAQRTPLMFIGEGPGADEDRTGRPFVGAAGQLLDKMIVAMQFQREEVFIANVVKCRPPGNRKPDPAEAAACLPYLHRQIELIQPQVIVTLGATPLQFLLGVTGITARRGKWLEWRGIPCMPTFHPSYLLRVPEDKAKVWADLQLVMQRLGKTPPPPRTPRRQDV